MDPMTPSTPTAMPEERKARLVSKYSSPKAKVKKTATSVHLNPKPTKHTATSTGN